MATRKERVVLELEDRFTAEIVRAAAAAKAFDRELGNVNRTSPHFTRAVATIERDSDGAGHSIDRLSGRLSILAQAGAAIGPALIPIAGAVTPAIAGITTQLGFAVAATGTTILAFQGVGDALESLNKAQLEPTTKNIEDARRALEDLSPAALGFVVELDKMGPAFRSVRDAASEGLFPGLTDSLDEVESLLPRVRGIVSEISSVTGEMANASAESLASPEWEEFFGFVEREARPTLTRLGQSVGNVTKGLAEMWIAFDPLSDDFQEGLLDATERFEDWAEGLSETEGFQEFLDYVRQNGPQALDTLGSIGNALLQIVEAAAPLGGPVLQVLEAIADVVSTIADSNIGTPLLTAVGALSALNLATGSFNRVSQSAFGSSAKRRVSSFTDELLNMDAANRRATLSVREFEKAEAQRRRTLARAGLVAGAGVAAVATGAADSQTAIFGLTGAMIGGAPGAVAGGIVGAFADYSAAGKRAAQATEDMSRAFETAIPNFDAMDSALENMRDGWAEMLDDVHSETGGEFVRNIFDPDVWEIGISELTGTTSEMEKYRDKMLELESVSGDLELALGELFQAHGDFGTNADLTAALSTALPVLAEMGYTIEDLAAAARDGSIIQLAEEYREFVARADTAEGRAGLLADALAGIGEETKTTAESASDLNAALSSILNPKIDLAEARDNWRDMLRNLADELSDLEDSEGGAIAGAREVFGDTDGASANREAIRGAVENLQSLIVKQAEAGRSAEQIGRTVEQEKQNFLDQAEAVGLNRREVEKYIRKLGLTPKNVATLIELKNAEEAKRELDEVTRDRTVKIGFSVADINLMLPKGKTLAQYDVGGWTGPGDRLQPAGIVHAEEFVVRKGPAEAFRPWLEHINSLPGYDSGGFVAARSVAPPAMGVAPPMEDIAQMVARATRPLWGDVTIQAQDMNDIRRQFREDAALAGSDGVRQP